MTKNSNSKNQLKGSISLFIASLIWGTAFVAQAKGADYIGGLTFSTLRSFIGAAFLVPVAIILERMSSARRRKTKNEEQRTADRKADAMDAEHYNINVDADSVYAQVRSQVLGTLPEDLPNREDIADQAASAAQSAAEDAAGHIPCSIPPGWQWSRLCG